MISLLFHIIAVCFLFLIFSNYGMWIVLSGKYEKYLESENGRDVPENNEPWLLNVEKYNDILYIYHENTFLAQGETREDIEVILLKAYPNRQFIVSDAGFELLYGRKP